MNVRKNLIVVLLLIVCGNSMTYGATFGQWASGFGLTGNETTIHCIGAGVTDLTGLANNYPNLTVLVMWGNPLGSIQSGDFDGLGNLTEMYLNENQITSLESGDFTGLSSLKYLHLNDNLITSIDSGDFDGLVNLERLDLGGNQLTSIESGDFVGLGNLTFLGLSGNQLTSIDSGDFAGPTNLMGLYLDDNQIADIDSSDFTGLGNLTLLSISGNLLTSIDSGDFVGLGNLDRLSLSGNQITGIESGDFTGLVNLTCLILSSNQITSIESGDFDGPTDLAQLYLKDNQITSIDSGDFTGLSSLEYLYLNDNSITSIDSGDFAGLSSLARLYLGGNQVATMDLSNSDLSLLRSFDIIGNPLTSVQLTDATFSQASFNALMNGGALLRGAAKESPGWCFGIAEIPGVLVLNMSGVDFSGISHISRMHTMDALEELLLIGATNVTGSDVSDLTAELASLNLLDVTGLWDTFDPTSQSTLNAWGAIPGNVLVYIPSESDPPTPDPATFAVAPAADSDTAISMTATTGSDASGPVSYLFTETSGNPGSTSSGWQASTSYTDSGLNASTEYTYTVTMRDAIGNAGIASGALSATTLPSPVTVPDVTGQAQATAESNIVAAGLVVGTVTTDYSMTVPAGDVISQNPTGGASVLPGTSVDIEVSLGVEMVTVPDVVGLAQATAEAAIVGVSLISVANTAYDAVVPAGDVISQNPAGGSSVEISSIVTIIVSLGVQPVTVPNVVGQAQATAESNIVAAGLVVGTVTTSYSGSVPAGDVISQNPTGGASVAPGSSVSIVVSLGVQMVTVPNVVGLAQATAQSNIVAAGLVVGTVTTSYNAVVPAGDVISQNPAGSTSALIGSSVDILVSLGVQPVTVPDVTGQAQATAESNIVAAGLVVGTVSTSYSGSVPAGDVISQNPTGGASVMPGTSVDIEVSLGVQMVTVPDVVGQAQATAEGNIVAAGLVVGTVTTSYNAVVPAGDVISQNPVGSTSVAIGSSVDIEVSLGVQPVTVPDVVGQAQATAESNIVAATLVVGTVTTSYSATVPAGNVISQNPTDGASVPPGTSVDLVVSLGVAPFDPVFINFQPSGATVPASYLADDGSVYGDRGNGETYGWNSDISADASDRDIDPDQRYDTLIKMDNDTWELEVPNGDYVVDLVMGDPLSSTPGTVEYQLEDGAWNSGTTVDTNHAGYTGTGFVNTNNTVGTWVEIAVDAPYTGSYDLTIRYALGNTDRPVDVSDDGVVEISGLNMPGTGAWANWSTVDFSLTLETGTNVIRFTATGSSGAANLDRVDVQALASAYSINDVSIEGVVINDPDGGDYFDEYLDVEVTVSDGKLTISDPGTGDTPKICFIDIEEAIPDEFDPPTPNPATFAVAPAADSDTAISMTATTGTDASGPVEYYFDATDGGNDSGWQTSTSYTDTGLTGSTEYTYTVQMRDSLLNTGALSIALSATTLVSPVTVPDVVGQAQATAESNIVAASLVVGTVSTSYSFTVPAGDVISQSPTGGSSVMPGTSVNIEVSLGVEMVTVPDVVGQAQATAEGNIVAASLVVGTVTTAYSPTVPTGDVISQNPTGGSSAEINSSVDIEVSLGVQPVTVPDVVGQAQATAESNIVAATLVVGTVTTAYSGSVPAGDVISQNPGGGSSVAPGTSVDIEVSLGVEMVTVPDVVGLAQATAQSNIVAASLVVGTVTTAYSPTVPTGDVISQSPTGGSSVEIGSSVAIEVSLGVQPVTVPDVVGQAQATAESNIVAATLVVGTVSTSYSAVVPAGDVISQNPTGGSSVAPGTSVNIEVSLGIQMVTVPDVVGQAQATAQSNIVAASLVVGTVTTAYSPTVPTGDVISQNPAGSTSVEIGSSVAIEVSLGVQPVTVPDVVGQAQATAESNIVAATLVVGTVSTSYSAVVPAGDVISQNPGGGSSVAPGTSVDIEVSLGTGGSTTDDFNPTEDAYVKQHKATTNINNNDLRVRVGSAGKQIDSYLKFTVSGVGTVTSAKLKVYSDNVNQGVDVYASASNSWSESTLIWNNAPGSTGSSVDFLNVTTGWVEFDVTSLITGNGTFSLILKGQGTKGSRDFSSSEGNNAPVLSVTY